MTGSNSSLNAEWVRLTNTRTYTINLRNWTLRDKANHVYSFGNSNVYLGAGKRLYIHTGKGINGSPDAQHRYWGLSGYVWNNGGDAAYLRTATARSSTPAHGAHRQLHLLLTPSCPGQPTSS
jgi:hypothetical protein